MINVRREWKGLLLLLLLLRGPVAAQSQPGKVEVEIIPGPASITLSEQYRLAFRLQGADLKEYSPFPEVEGFRKNGKTSTTTTRTVQGRSFTELTVTQRYLPYGEGDFVIKPFQLTVNGQVVRSPGIAVHVAGTSPVARSGQGPAPPGIGLLDQLLGKRKPALYQDVPDHAFLALEAEKQRVFVGEGVRVGLYFYLLPADQALLAFNDYTNQLPRLIQQLHQTTAWQVVAAEAGGVPDTVRRQGQRYLRFRLAENFYYPLNNEPLRFPPLALTMTKFRLLKKPEPGVDNRLPATKTFVAPGLTIAVRPLPPHPRREAVPVGSYHLSETSSRQRLRVGEALTYTFAVEGQGNLAALLPPPLAPHPALEAYGPEVRTTATATGGRKLFRYRLVARQPGALPLDSLLQLIVFNPATVRYDTLRPLLRPVVRGAAQAPSAVLPKPQEDPFYGPALAQADAKLQPLDVYRQVRYYTNWVLLGLLAVAGGSWWWAGRKTSSSD